VSAPPRTRSGRPRRPAEEPPARKRSDLGSRVLVAIPAVIVAIFLVERGGTVFALGMFILGAVALHELYSMFAEARPIRIAGFVVLAGSLAAARFGGQYQMVLVLAASFPVIFVLTIVRPQPGGNTLAIAITQLGIFWIALALAHAVLLRGLSHGDGILIDLLVGTFLGDTGAYLGGRSFGRRPLAPRISPNKTVEGLLIGMVTALAATWCAGLYQDWLSGPHALLLGLAPAIFAPMGDLFESIVKRDAGTKDTGRLFGAHGGALDRLDAVFFVIPAGYYLWVWLL
jgi:phosphatidate cytidylyltransferase